MYCILKLTIMKTYKAYDFIEEGEYGKWIENIRFELKDYIIKHNLKSLVLGISGGIDSALVAALASKVCKELNIPLIGRSISIESKFNESLRAGRVGEAFCDDFKEIVLDKLYYEHFNGSIAPQGKYESDLRYKIRKGNVKARMRMILLYDLAHQNSGITLSTDNYTEFLLSYFTIHGDHFDVGIIQEFWKTEIYAMSEYLLKNELDIKDKIESLKECIECNSTDGLGITKTDLDQILPDFRKRHTNTRTGYNEVDLILMKYIRTGNIDNQMVIDRFLNTEFKRNWPIIFTREQIQPK